jgi:hypothetical protein
VNTIELFSGTKSFSKVAESLGYLTFTVDNDKKLEPDLAVNLLVKSNWNLIEYSRFSYKNKVNLKPLNILWASPPCTAFSVASIGTHWIGGKKKYIPKTKEAEIGIELLDNTIKYISVIKPLFWFIENPRGIMRKVIDKIFKKYGVKDYCRVTVSYCQYGDTRRKPTDIWTNLKGWQGRQCRNNSVGCSHIRAPRGSKTGTQGLKNAKERGIIPQALFIEIFNSIEKLRGR